MSRFDSIQYDDSSRELQAMLKEQFERLEWMIVGRLPASRAQSLALTHLEEAYAWVGKAVRDEQIARAGPVQAEEGRSSS